MSSARVLLLGRCRRPLPLMTASASSGGIRSSTSCARPEGEEGQRREATRASSVRCAGSPLAATLYASGARASSPAVGPQVSARQLWVGSDTCSEHVLCELLYHAVDEDKGRACDLASTISMILGPPPFGSPPTNSISVPSTAARPTFSLRSDTISMDGRINGRMEGPVTEGHRHLWRRAAVVDVDVDGALRVGRHCRRRRRPVHHVPETRHQL